LLGARPHDFRPGDFDLRRYADAPITLSEHPFSFVTQRFRAGTV
jgi:hypothetical protein